jgi:peptide/nickel transport system substrate-binding protein
MTPWLKRLLGLAAATSAVALLPTDHAAFAQGRELKVAVQQFTGEITDPAHAGFGMLVYQAPMFDYLVTIDAKREIVPGLAEKWTVASDGLTYTFHLRKGVRFHTGDEMTSEDVKFSIERLAGKTGVFIAPLLAALDSIQTPDPYTAVFKLKKPDADFIGYLSPVDTTIGAVVSKKYITRVGDEEFANKPVGTGVWKLTERKKGAYFAYEAVPHPYRPKPAYDKLRITLVPEESTRVAMLQRGEADLGDIGYDAAKRLKASGDQVFEVQNAFSAFVSFIGVWEERAKKNNIPQRLENVNVRKALAMAIDRKELLDFMIDGRGQLAGSFLGFPGTFGFDAEMEKKYQIAYDPAGAKKLLAEAGYPNGFKQRMYSMPLAGATWFPKAMEVIADYWKKIGIDVELIQTEWGALNPIIYGRPDEGLGAVYDLRTSNTAFLVGKFNNYVVAAGKGQVANVNWDDDFAKLSAITDPKTREAEFRKMMYRFNETYTLIPLFFAHALFGANKNLDGWTPISGWPSFGLQYEHFKPRS